MKKLAGWWNGCSNSEKLMYGLIVLLLVGIAARFGYIRSELADTIETYKERMKPE